MSKDAVNPAGAEHGWVIEGAWSDLAEPQYWAGSSLWMSDHMCAIRFAREHDAKQAASAMLDGMNIRICEHIWTGGIRESVSLQNIRETVSEPDAPQEPPCPECGQPWPRREVE